MSAEVATAAIKLRLQGIESVLLHLRTEQDPNIWWDRLADLQADVEEVEVLAKAAGIPFTPEWER